jgi:hypothetical protein
MHPVIDKLLARQNTPPSTKPNALTNITNNSSSNPNLYQTQVLTSNIQPTSPIT